MTTTTLKLPMRSEHAITVCGGDPVERARLLQVELQRLQASPLSVYAFGGVAECGVARGILPDQGVSWLQGDCCRDGGFTSFQAHAVSGAAPVQVVRQGSATGWVFEDDAARYCRISGLTPSDLSASRAEQTRQVLESAERVLDGAGFRFSETIRTWFYLDHLLEWYDDFNAVRTEFFRTRGVFERLVPASTGIGAGNALGGALTCDLLALAPKAGRVSVQVVASPLQDSALKYRSSFSRAVEVRYPDCRQLLISGTASIDREGRSVHLGDPASQVDMTLRVVEALLTSNRMGWANATRGIAYFKRIADLPLMERWFKTRGVPAFSLAIAETDICRHDLDFEIEVDAVSR